jgi:hypothetical protein
MTEQRKKLRKTTIHIRAYCCDLEITVKRQSFLSIEDAELYVGKEGWDTAMVIGVTHFKDAGEVYISNECYIDPTEISYNTYIK